MKTREWNKLFKVLRKRKKDQLRTLNSTKLSFTSERERLSQTKIEGVSKSTIHFLPVPILMSLTNNLLIIILICFIVYANIYEIYAYIYVM